MVRVGRDGDIHVPKQVAVGGNGKRGGNAEARSCLVASEGVGGFRSQLVLSNNVAMVNL